MSASSHYHRLAIRSLFLLCGLAAIGAAVAAEPVIGPVKPRPPQDRFIRGNQIFSASVRFASGIDVSVGGTVGPFESTLDTPPLQGGSVNRVYNDGFVGVDANGNVNDTTQNWHIENLSQVSDGRVNFHVYSVTSSAGFSGEGDGDGTSIDLQMGRVLFRAGDRVVFGLTGGFSLGAVDTSGSLATTVDLASITDTYDLRGFTPGSAPISGSASSAAIGSVILNRTMESMPGAGTINSAWDLTGGYYNVRIGPAVYIRLTRRLALHAGAGASVFYAATDFEYTDSLVTPSSEFVRDTATTNAEDWLTGYYAEGSLQWWFTDSTGIFLGATMHKADKLRQSVGSRNVTIDFGKTTQFSLGLNYQF